MVIAATRMSVLDVYGDVSAQILTASRAGRVLDCRGAAGRGGVAAAEIRKACLSPTSMRDPFGIRLANARIDGLLDLRFAQIDGPLHFLGCHFEQALRIAGADISELLIVSGEHAGAWLQGRIGDSHLPGLLAGGARVRRNLSLSGTRVTGRHASTASMSKTSAVWLTEAEIGGRLLAVGTTIDTNADRAIQADRTIVNGDVRLVGGFHANAEVRMIAAQIGGSLDLTSATFAPLDGRALDLAKAQIGGSLFVIDDPDGDRRPQVLGRVELGNARVGGRVLIRRATLVAPPGGVGGHDYQNLETVKRVAVNAAGLTVDGDFLVEPGTSIDGAMMLPRATLRGAMQIDKATMMNSHDVALDLSQAELGAGVQVRSSTIKGTVNLDYARLTGPLRILDTDMTAPAQRDGLSGIGAVVRGDVELLQMRARGGRVNFRSATISGVINAEGAAIENPGDASLSLHQAHVGGNVRLCGGFASVGVVTLNRVTIDGRLRCDGGSFTWVESSPDGESGAEVYAPGAAFEAISATIRSGIGLGWHINAGAVDFTDAATTYLGDDASNDWPVNSHIAGFTYDRYAAPESREGSGQWDVRARISWLGNLSTYDPRPWGQAAQVLANNGNESGAEAMLMARRRYERRHRIGLQKHAWRRGLDHAENLVVGYGYRPQRVLWVMAALLAAVTITLSVPTWRGSMRATDQNGAVYTPDGANGCVTGAVRCLEPVLYAVDTVVPIIDLKQRETWYPNREAGGAWLQWWLNTSTILGWIASTVFALSLTRLGRAYTGNR